MPLQTPGSLRKKLFAEGAQAGQNARRPSPTLSLLQRILPAKIARTFNYARNNPVRVAAHSLPFGLGALFGLSGEAEFAARINALMIALAKDTAGRQQGAPNFQQPRQQFPIQGAPYRPPAVQPYNSNSRQPKTFINLQRSQPPVSSRFVAQKASLRITSAFPTTLAGWVANRARTNRTQNNSNRKSVV